jgi:hypothetical protein
MGRRTITDEERQERIPVEIHADLVVALEMQRAARDNQERADIHMRAVLASAVNAGVSYRDLETVTGLGRTKLNAIVTGA